MSEVKITPFEVSIAPNDVADLRDRLKRTRWTDWLPNSGWGYGTDPDYLKRLCAYWQDDYGFGGYVTRLNAFPQYIADVEGERLQFYHVPSKVPTAKTLEIGRASCRERGCQSV